MLSLFEYCNTGWFVIIYDSLLGAESEDDCSPCTGGSYCETEGLSTPTGLCAPGYYCPSNDTISARDPNGYLCPIGG